MKEINFNDDIGLLFLLFILYEEMAVSRPGENGLRNGNWIIVWPRQPHLACLGI
jgi:hypothetical protein